MLGRLFRILVAKEVLLALRAAEIRLITWTLAALEYPVQTDEKKYNINVPYTYWETGLPHPIRMHKSFANSKASNCIYYDVELGAHGHVTRELLRRFICDALWYFSLPDLLVRRWEKCGAETEWVAVLLHHNVDLRTAPQLRYAAIVLLHYTSNPLPLFVNGGRSDDWVALVRMHLVQSRNLASKCRSYLWQSNSAQDWVRVDRDHTNPISQRYRYKIFCICLYPSSANFQVVKPWAPQILKLGGDRTTGKERKTRLRRECKNKLHRHWWAYTQISLELALAHALLISSIFLYASLGRFRQTHHMHLSYYLSRASLVRKVASIAL